MYVTFWHDIKWLLQGILAEILEFVMGTGLIPADGEVWKVRRRAIVPAVHRKVIYLLMNFISTPKEVILQKTTLKTLTLITSHYHLDEKCFKQSRMNLFSINLTLDLFNLLYILMEWVYTVCGRNDGPIWNSHRAIMRQIGHVSSWGRGCGDGISLLKIDIGRYRKSCVQLWLWLLV